MEDGKNFKYVLIQWRNSRNSNILTWGQIDFSGSVSCLRCNILKNTWKEDITHYNTCRFNLVYQVQIKLMWILLSLNLWKLYKEFAGSYFILVQKRYVYLNCVSKIDVVRLTEDIFKQNTLFQKSLARWSILQNLQRILKISVDIITNLWY